MSEQWQTSDQWYQQGVLLDEQGQSQRAIASYTKAIDLQSDYYEAWVRRGLALMLLEQFQPAIANFNQAVALKMDLDLAWYLKAYCHAQMQADDFALLALQKAFALNPNQWIEMAHKDPAFDGLRQDPRFQELVVIRNPD
ncbi:tetratricopeptide repeat protein [Leptolyngbya sp. Heron Island J]|uniref:tetratricopeptide repeat protein n=1 Tax=Leptolyngbya sp. Heron Island J TaxID=1385935 RepID=UPI0003B9DEDB|nr:tetratricopeptide repeat protein [Leptolyngbya sp. Heron Island J]ESA34221.1 tetratricopeptide repeat protein [Leptolyngbya sp. Heron Island J]